MHKFLYTSMRISNQMRKGYKFTNRLLNQSSSNIINKKKEEKDEREDNQKEESQMKLTIKKY